MKITEQGEIILVDTSVWIEYLRKKEIIFEEINNLVEKNKVAICKLIVAELIQGSKTDKEVRAIKDLASIVPVLEERQDNWLKAGELSFNLRRKGVTVGLADCYISIMVNSYNALLFSLDEHFRVIGKHFSIGIYEI